MYFCAQAFVLTHRFGMSEDGRAKTLQEIGEMLDVTSCTAPRRDSHCSVVVAVRGLFAVFGLFSSFLPISTNYGRYNADTLRTLSPQVTRERVRQVEHMAVQKLRNPKNAIRSTSHSDTPCTHINVLETPRANINGHHTYY